MMGVSCGHHGNQLLLYKLQMPVAILCILMQGVDAVFQPIVGALSRRGL